VAAELTTHLGYAPHARPPSKSDNARNGKSPQTVQTEHGPVDWAVPRDRAGTCEPTVVKQRQRRLEGVDNNVRALYAQGLTTRDIQGPPRSVIWDGGVADTHLHHDRCSRRGYAPLAESDTGTGLSDFLFRLSLCKVAA